MQLLGPPAAAGPLEVERVQAGGAGGVERERVRQLRAHARRANTHAAEHLLVAQRDVVSISRFHGRAHRNLERLLQALVEVAQEAVAHPEQHFAVDGVDGDFHAASVAAPKISQVQGMVISSRENELWKAMRRLSRSKGRRRPEERDLVLLEGPHLLEAALDAGLAPETVLATAELLSADTPLLRRLPRPPLVVAPALLDELADADSPRGLLATVRMRERDVSELPDLLGLGSDRAVVVCADGIQDPANLGALARTGEAAGAIALVASPGCVAWRHPRSLRASTGSLLRLPVFAGVEPSELRRVLSPLPCTWIALVPEGGQDLYGASLEGRLVLLVGAEGPGLTDEALALADQRLTIPLARDVESLNAHVAAAVVLFELRRRAIEGGAAGPTAR